MAVTTIDAAPTRSARGQRDRSPGFVLAVAVLALATPFIAWSLWAGHVRSVSSDAQADLNGAIAEVMATVTTAQSSMRGFVLSGTDAFLAPYRDASARYEADLDALAQASGIARTDAEGVESLSDLAREEMGFFDGVVETRRSAGFDAASAVVVAGDGKRILDEMRAEAASLTAASSAAIADNTRFERWLTWLQAGVFVPTAAAALYLGVLAWRRQRQFRAGAELLSDLMTAAPVGVAFFDGSSRLLRSNDEYARVAGEAEPAAATKPTNWFSPVVDRVLAERAAVTDGRFEFGADGEREGIVSAFPTSGSSRERAGAGLFVLDTTEQQRTAAALSETKGQFTAIADNIPQLAWIARPTGEVFWHNRRWLDYTGTDREQMAREGWSNVVDPDHAERVAAGYAAALASGTPWEDTFPIRAADGTFRWFLTQAVPIVGESGRVLRWFGTNTDVTKQRALEEEFLAAKELAENANRAKSQFIANMSHELRTPLSAVIGYAELLEEEVEDLGETHLLADLKKIEGNARHLLSLINNVLDLSKIEAERMDVFPETFDLATVMDEVASTVGSLVGKKNNTLRIEHDGSLGKVHTDQVKVRQCLLNLLSNASKFTEAGTITLRGTRASDSDRDWITLAVTDSGIGMTDEQVAQLFERFRQADASTTRKFGGTGLGLAITQAFCRLLGGDIGATSAIGEGTTFTIRIPAEFAPPPEDEQTQTGGDALAVGPAGTVLAIDDDPHARELVTRFLSKEGFAVRTASDGVAGLEMARALVPDVILLDVTMPKKDGWSVLAELKADPVLGAIPVVMITILDEQRLGFALGASDYLLKPVQWDKLKEVMDRFRADGSGAVLAIDDDVDTLARYATMVERQGIAFMSATNGRLGLDRVRERKPDLILLDLNMPVMDGFDFLKELRAEPSWRDIPVVVLSSKDLTRAERSTLEGAANEVLAKTEASMRELFARIRDLLTARHA